MKRRRLGEGCCRSRFGGLLKKQIVESGRGPRPGNIVRLPRGKNRRGLPTWTACRGDDRPIPCRRDRSRPAASGALKNLRPASSVSREGVRKPEKGNGDAGRRWCRRSRSAGFGREKLPNPVEALRLGRKRRRRRGGGRRRRQGRASSGRGAARFRGRSTCRRRLRGRSARSSIRGCPDRSTRGS